MDSIIRGVFCTMMSILLGVVFYYEGGMFSIFACGFFLAFAVSAFIEEISLRVDPDEEDEDEEDEEEKDLESTNDVKENT